MIEHGLTYTFFIEPFTKGDLIDCMVGIVFWVVFLFLGAVILLFIIEAIDTAFMPTLKGRGKITNKTKEKAYNTTTYYKVGDVMVPRTHHHKKQYVLTIKIGDREDTVDVKKQFFNEVNVDDEIDCEYNLGRLFKDTIYIDKIK